jgi:hypothetical protein
MDSPPLARLTPISREHLIRRHLEEGVPLKVLMARAGICLRSAYKLLARFRDGFVAGTGGSTECSPHPAADD